MKQAYMTTNYPVDKQGNYYYPIYIPDDAVPQLPITDQVPDPSLGSSSLKFDWQANKWGTADTDPTLKMVQRLQSQMKALQLTSLGGIQSDLSDSKAKKASEDLKQNANLSGLAAMKAKLEAAKKTTEGDNK